MPMCRAIDQLLHSHPNYQRPRVEGFSKFDRSVRADLLHLKLYHASRLTDFSKIQKSMEFLRSVAAEGTEALNATRSQNDTDDADDSDVSYSSPTSDQLRAAALPSVMALVAQIHNTLLPQAVKDDGAKAVRDYLRGLMKESGPFASYASFKLLDIDRVILAHYRADAQKAWREKKWAAARAGFSLIIKEYEGTTEGKKAEGELKQVIVAQYKDEAVIAFAANNFDGAKGAYRRIIAEYGDTDDATWAEGELKKIVPVAVAYYKTEADKSFRPGAEDQFGKPQTKAVESYERMYQEDPDGKQAAYAFFKWSEALGTTGKSAQGVKQMEQWLEKYPQSPLRAEVLYTLGFFLGGLPLNRNDEAIKWLKQVVDQYPKSEQAPEALWHIAFFHAWSNNRFKEGLPYLERLHKEYPQSFRWRHTEKWIKRFNEKIASGGTWP